MHTIDYQYLRPQKAEDLKLQHTTPFARRDRLDYWHGENATVLPMRFTDAYNWIGHGGVLDQKGNYVDLSATHGMVTKGYPVDNVRFQDKKVVYCGYFVFHWGHFLVDVVSRLWYFLRNDPSIDSYVFIVPEGTHPNIQGNYKEFFTLLNIWDRLEFVNTPTTYREVIVPELGFQRKQYYSPLYVDIFDTVAENIQIDPSWKPLKKLYFSRSQLKKATAVEFGFETFDNFFEKNGYTVLYPETLSLSRMIYYIRNAETVASVSGSLPHNMLFGRHGQKLEILERCVFNNDWQVCVNIMRQLHTTYIDGNLSLYTVPMTGPFMAGYNSIAQRFAADHQYLAPDAQYCSEQYHRNCLKKYMHAYQDLFRYRWFLEDYLIATVDYHYEAYLDGAHFFEDYISGRKPFLWHHYFEFHYWKQFIKRILKRFR